MLGSRLFVLQEMLVPLLPRQDIASVIQDVVKAVQGIEDTSDLKRALPHMDNQMKRAYHVVIRRVHSLVPIIDKLHFELSRAIRLSISNECQTVLDLIGDTARKAQIVIDEIKYIGGHLIRLRLLTNQIATVLVEQEHIDKEQQCAVCLTDFTLAETVRKLVCNHMFHDECISKWLRERIDNCPLCRKGTMHKQELIEYFEYEKRKEINKCLLK